MTNKTIILILVSISIVSAIVYLESRKTKGTGNVQEVVDVVPREMQSKSSKSGKYELAKEITTPDGFINTSKDFKLTDIIGKKVILIDFWTYSCINCQRTTPYLNAWYEKYKAQGLEIVGIHTPEFDFEKDIKNVSEAVKKYGIKFPVVLDNDYSTWQAYKNRYWPRKYLIDIDGYIVYDHIGEGAYDETEREIQKALEERNTILGENNSIPSDIVTPEKVISVNPKMPLSPEIYFGSSRNENLANGQTRSAGKQSFTAPSKVKTDNLYLDKEWDIQPEYAQNLVSNAKILFGYQAKNVYLVAESNESNIVHILRDGKEINKLEIKGAGSYQIIADEGYGEHVLEIVIEKPGLKAFTFTFG